MDEDPRLVVGRAAAPEAAVLLDGLEGFGRPLLLVAGGLHVVVRVEEQGGTPRGLEPLAIRVGMRAGHLEQLHVVQADAAQEVTGGLAALADLLLVESLEGDAGDAHQLLQLLQVGALVLLVLRERLLDGAVVHRSGLVLLGRVRHGGAP